MLAGPLDVSCRRLWRWRWRWQRCFVPVFVYVSSTWALSLASVDAFAPSKSQFKPTRKSTPRVAAGSRNACQLHRKRGCGRRFASSPIGFDADANDAKDEENSFAALRRQSSAVTALRVGLPALLASVLSYALYTPVALSVASAINDSGVFFVVANDSSQYIQNILTTCGLTFSILVGQTFYFMYQQQEAIFVSLFEEVAEAKSLLEQLSLVSEGRDGMHAQVLESVERYVDHDLRMVRTDPAVLLSARPEDDPLETVMYLTGVGQPGVVYDTVRSLRQARARRLGALQRKLPPLQMVLLWTLAFIVLATFPLLGAGSQTIGGPAILSVQSAYISLIVFGIVAVLGVVDELRKLPAGGAYNVDAVLDEMVKGLEDELHGRIEGRYAARNKAAPTVDPDPMVATEEDFDAAAATTSASSAGWGSDINKDGEAMYSAVQAEGFGPDDGSLGFRDGEGNGIVSEGDGDGEPESPPRKRIRPFRWMRRGA